MDGMNVVKARGYGMEIGTKANRAVWIRVETTSGWAERSLDGLNTAEIQQWFGELDAPVEHDLRIIKEGRLARTIQLWASPTECFRTIALDAPADEIRGVLFALADLFDPHGIPGGWVGRDGSVGQA